MRRAGSLLVLTVAMCLAAGCARGPAPRAVETFAWSAQPIRFEPPPETWRREGERSGGLLGVRFILTGGGGQCITVAAYHALAGRDRRTAIARLIAGYERMKGREFLDSLSLARARTDDPLSEREAAAARDINAALDRAMEDHLADRRTFVTVDLETALRAASTNEPTLAEILPRIRLRPERMHEPERWRLGYERDTTAAGRPAFWSDDTLITPEQTLLYRQVFWVVNGCPFQAVYQGTPQNAQVFDRLVTSIQFPDSTVEAPR